MRRAGWLAMSRAIALSVLCCAAALASAQGADPTTVVNAGTQVAEMIDTGRAAEVWDGASAAAKKLVAKEKFVQTVDATRQPLGSVQSRAWVTVARHESPGTPQLPAGNYVNIEYLTSFSGGRSATELVSFRLDDDNTWRFTGYFIR